MQRQGHISINLSCVLYDHVALVYRYPLTSYPYLINARGLSIVQGMFTLKGHTMNTLVIKHPNNYAAQLRFMLQSVPLPVSSKDKAKINTLLAKQA